MTNKPRSRHIPNEVVTKLLDESRSRCCLCRVLIDPEQDDPETLFDTLEKHHIIQFSEGGEHTVENLLLACANCHTKIHRHPEKYPVDKLRQAKEHWLAMEGVVPTELAMGEEIGDAIRVTFLLKSLNLRYQVAASSQATVGDLALFIGQNVMKPLGEYDHRGKWLNLEGVDLNFEARRGHLDRRLSLAAVPVQTGDVLTARVTQVVEPIVLPPLPFMVGLGEDEAEALAREPASEPRLREVVPEPEPTRPVWERRYPFEPEMVFVPAGPFWMGTDRGRLERAAMKWELWMNYETYRQVTLPGYWIGRYPVTNAEYRAFVEGGGYQTRVYWTEAGWKWKRDRTQPGRWTNERYNGLRQPVVDVLWYEAEAYCRWLSEMTGRQYRLPSEAEWEKAARGTDGRIWPWGDEWDPDRCNTGETGPRMPTPVEKYSPQGDSPYGCADMAGNVWEWCVTKRDTLRDAFMQRGGSFHDAARYARCAFRGCDTSLGDFKSLGFRCGCEASPISPRSGS